MPGRHGDVDAPMYVSMVGMVVSMIIAIEVAGRQGELLRTVAVDYSEGSKAT